MLAVPVAQRYSTPMPYVHEVHTSYTNAIIRHMREEKRPSGLIVSHSVAVSEAIFTVQQSPDLEIAATPLNLDNISPSTLTNEIRNVDFAEATEKIRQCLTGMGKIAALKFGIFEPDEASNPMTDAEFDEIKSFGTMLSRALDTRQVTADGIGLYL